jgi:biopolymer transport protein TolR
VFWQKRQAGESENSEVNMTPLIDISLVLVVILLLATPLAFESSIDLQRAEASGRQAAQPAPAARVELVILSEDSIRVNRITVARDDYEKILQPLVARQPLPQVVISCAEGVSHGTFVEVLDVTKLCGVDDIAVTRR